MKLHIADRAKTVLIKEGFSRFTFDRVAAEAGCAKGLIAYHHQSRNVLLGAVAGLIRQDRLARRIGALGGTGSSAIDGLWNVILWEHRSGESAAWLGLLALREPEVVEKCALTPSEATSLGRRVIEALSLESEVSAVGATTVAALDGFAAALLQGIPGDQARDGYHRFWLGLLG